MKSNSISLAYSPCPNDTYLFSAIASGRLNVPNVEFSINLHDIETLNKLAIKQRYDIMKVSCYTYLKIQDSYRLLETGASMGYGCGPLLLAFCPLEINALKDCKVAFPGELTTAHLLFQLLGVEVAEQCFIPYDEIIPRVRSHEFDCGVIIHESRFTYEEAGLYKVIDLGEWWQEQTCLPVPLGCFVIRRGPCQYLAEEFENLMRSSISEADKREIAADDYVRQNAQEMGPDILEHHIRLYVNDFTIDLGKQGHHAIDVMGERAEAQGLLA